MIIDLKLPLRAISEAISTIIASIHELRKVHKGTVVEESKALSRALSSAKATPHRPTALTFQHATKPYGANQTPPRDGLVVRRLFRQSLQNSKERCLHLDLCVSSAVTGGTLRCSVAMRRYALFAIAMATYPLSVVQTPLSSFLNLIHCS